MTIGPEEQLARRILDLAALSGWRCFRVEQSARWSPKAGRRVRNVNVQGVGFPDLVLARERPSRLIFAELKRDLGPRGGASDHQQPSNEQREWLAVLSAVADMVRIERSTQADSPPRVLVYLWRPTDWPEIERTLLL